MTNEHTTHTTRTTARKRLAEAYAAAHAMMDAAHNAHEAALHAAAHNAHEATLQAANAEYDRAMDAADRIIEDALARAERDGSARPSFRQLICEAASPVRRTTDDVQHLSPLDAYDATIAAARVLPIGPEMVAAFRAAEAAYIAAWAAAAKADTTEEPTS